MSYAMRVRAATNPAREANAYPTERPACSSELRAWEALGV